MLKWRKLPEGSQTSTDGRYLIEKIWAPGARSYDWYLTGPDWDHGPTGTLRDAKERAQRHSERLEALGAGAV